MKKHEQTSNEMYRAERRAKQSHLDDNLMSASEIRESLQSLTPQQITALLTLAYNSYEESYAHIWFARGVREQHIEDVYDLVQALRDDPFIRPLHPVYTGLGIDDPRTKHWK